MSLSSFFNNSFTEAVCCNSFGDTSIWVSAWSGAYGRDSTTIVGGEPWPRNVTNVVLIMGGVGGLQSSIEEVLLVHPDGFQDEPAPAGGGSLPSTFDTFGLSPEGASAAWPCSLQSNQGTYTSTCPFVACREGFATFMSPNHLEIPQSCWYKNRVGLQIMEATALHASCLGLNLI